MLPPETVVSVLLLVPPMGLDVLLLGPLVLLVTVPAGLVLVPLMLLELADAPPVPYFCSSSETLVPSAEICCLICSTSLAEAVIVVVVADVAPVVLPGVGTAAPGAGVATTRSSWFLHAARLVAMTTALAANKYFCDAITFLHRKVGKRRGPVDARANRS